MVLKVFELPDSRNTDAYSKANLAVVKAFQDKHPEIELRAFSGIRIEGMDLDSGPLLAIAGGVAPDILYVNFRQSDTYIQNGLLYPLDEFIARESPKNMELRVEKPVWQVIRRKKIGDAREKVWALPYETLVRVLMYRKDLFRRVGLDPNRPPRTWEEFALYARKLTNAEQGTWGTVFAIGAQAAYDWLPFLWAAGGDAVTYDPAKGIWQATFASEAGVTAMEYYLRLATQSWTDANGKPQQGYAQRDGNWGHMWSDGKIGMRMDYLSLHNMGGRYDPNLYGFAPSPAGPSGSGGSEINCRMMAIFSGAGISNDAGVGDRDPQRVREAAWEYIRFYDSEEARQIRMQVMVESGYGKMQNPVFLQRYGYENYLRHAPTGWMETFEKAMREGKPEPYGDNCQKVYEFMTYPLDELIGMEMSGKLSSDPDERRQQIRAVLLAAQDRTNAQMIGSVAPEVRSKRERLAAVVAALILETSTASSDNPVAVGLPIGNLTSQFFANVYLDPLDHYVAETLKAPYLRYMDDMLLFAQDKAVLKNALPRVEAFLGDKLKLHLKKDSVLLNNGVHGLPFLGFRIFPDLIRIKKENLGRLEAKIRLRQHQYRHGLIGETELYRSVQSVIAFGRIADSRSCLQKLCHDLG